LYPSEVVQFPLDADLVVPSACDTAVGPVEGEEGISTLARALLLAGAHTVVSTLWTIDDDSTLYLMKVFYGELGRKKSAPEALRIAKRSMLRKFGPRKAVPLSTAGASRLPGESSPADPCDGSGALRQSSAIPTK